MRLLVRMIRSASWLFTALLGLSGVVAAAPNAITKPYLFSADNCSATGCITSQFSSSVYLLQSDDGVNWSVVPGLAPFQGGVPAVLRRGNTIYLVSMPLSPIALDWHYEVRRYRMDTGIWDPPVTIAINDAQYPGEANSPAMILDPQGNIALLSDTSALCEYVYRPCNTTHLRITTEISGSDGTQFNAQVADLLTDTFAGQVGSVQTNGPLGNYGTGDATIYFDATRYIIFAPIANVIQGSPLLGTRVFYSPNVYGPYTLSSTLPGGMITSNSAMNSGIAGVTTFYNAARKKYWNYGSLPAPSVYRLVTSDLDHQLDIGQLIPANVVFTAASLGVDPTNTVQHLHFATNWSGAQTISATVSPRSLGASTGTATTATVTITNSDTVTAGDCFVEPITSFPGTFSYQATTPASAAVNTPVNVPGNGANQTFSIAFTTTEPFAATEIRFRIGCASSTNAVIESGVNTLTLTSTGQSITSTGGTITAGTGSTPSTTLPPPPIGQSAFTASTGLIPSSAVAVTVSGTLNNASLSVCLHVPPTVYVGPFNVYVVAMVPGGLLGQASPAWYVKPAAPQFWSPLAFPIPAYLERTTENGGVCGLSLIILENLDISSLRGTEVYIGYGASDTEMLSASRYRGVYKVQ